MFGYQNGKKETSDCVASLANVIYPLDRLLHWVIRAKRAEASSIGQIPALDFLWF